MPSSINSDHVYLARLPQAPKQKTRLGLGVIYTMGLIPRLGRQWVFFTSLHIPPMSHMMKTDSIRETLKARRADGLHKQRVAKQI